MDQDYETDVLICGAGASGVILAIDLARRGVSFRLIEKMHAPFRGSRGKALQPRTQEVFEDFDIVDKVFAAGGFYPPQREYRKDGSCAESAIMEHTVPTPGEPYQQPLMVAQFLTEGVMRERLCEAGHRPEFSCELVGFEQDQAGVLARLANSDGQEQLRTRYLIGTDGGRSFVRHTLNIAFSGETLGLRAVVADTLLKTGEKSGAQVTHYPKPAQAPHPNQY